MTTDNDFILQIRETVTIVRPMPSVLPRGNNTDKIQQPTTSIRMHKEYLSAINEAANLCGMSRSAFMTWCANYVALDIINQHREYKRKKGK